MLGDNNQYHFHTGGICLIPVGLLPRVSSGLLRKDGAQVSTTSTGFPSSLSILSS